MAPGQPSSKRLRIHDDDAQRPLSPSEELSQVADLVERRRLQNRISQRKYRVRIRERLETLEALVDNTDKEQIASSSKSPENARNVESGSDKQRTHEGSRHSPQHHSATFPSETPSSGNMGGFLNTSTAQFDDIYGFAAPHSPINPQGFPDHVSAPESSPANRISSATTSMDVDPEQSTAHEQEQLEGSTGAPCILDDVSAQASTGSMSPLLPNRQSASFSPIPYGYPITPMSVPVQPLAPGQLPRKSVSQIDQPVLTEPEANSDVTQPSSHPCPMVSSMQSAGYSQPQQYVWVPVPIMTGLPPPPSATMSRAPHNVRPGGPGGDNAVGRRC